MRLLDLFCGAGGAAKGYYNAGFTEIVGVDICPQSNYPYEFLQIDLSSPTIISKGFDLIHASPPCQRFSTASGKSDRSNHPDLLRPIRRLLENQSTPYVIENVEYAPLKNPLILCGTMFPNLHVLRHRFFEASFPIPQPYREGLCSNHPLVYSRKNRNATYYTVAGGGNCPVGIARKAMNIPWMTQRELSQAIPPDYTEYVGKFAATYISS